MAECNPWDKASRQHMALRHQEDSVRPAVLVHPHRHSIALHQVCEATQWECQNLQLESQQDLQKQTQTLYSTEGNQ